MANAQLGNIHGVAAVGGKNDQATPYLDTDLVSVAAMRTRLAAISATTYTSAVLDRMTVNDMVYAIRRNDDPTTIR